MDRKNLSLAMVRPSETQLKSTQRAWPEGAKVGRGCHIRKWVLDAEVAGGVNVSFGTRNLSCMSRVQYVSMLNCQIAKRANQPNETPEIACLEPYHPTDFNP